MAIIYYTILLNANVRESYFPFLYIYLEIASSRNDQQATEVSTLLSK